MDLWSQSAIIGVMTQQPATDSEGTLPATAAMNGLVLRRHCPKATATKHLAWHRGIQEALAHWK